MADVVAAVPVVVAAPKEEGDRLKTVEAERETFKRDAITARRLLERQKKEALTLGQKLSDYEKLQKEKADWTRERGEFEGRLNRAKSVFGDKWTELVDGAPITPEQMQAREEKLAERIRKEMADAESAKQAAARKQLEAKNAAVREKLADEGKSVYEANAMRYKGFAKMGTPDEVGRVIAQRIESTWRQTGKAPTAKEAADSLRQELLDMAKDFAEDAEVAAAPVVEVKKSVVDGLSQRKTITNDLTGSTRATNPKRSEDERRKAADEAFRKIHFKG